MMSLTLSHASREREVTFRLTVKKNRRHVRLCIEVVLVAFYTVMYL